jgi:hypothetical protein
MIGTGVRSRRTLARLWISLTAVQVLLCIGASLVSLVLPDDPSPAPGYYDGDGDDAAATSEGFNSVLDFTLRDHWTPPPILTFAPLGRSVAPVSQPNPGLSQPPLLRSPPA